MELTLENLEAALKDLCCTGCRAKLEAVFKPTKDITAEDVNRAMEMVEVSKQRV